MNIQNYDELKERLVFDAEDEYREFTSKLISSKRPILGVRVPKVRELADEVSLERIDDFLEIEPVTLEEVLARGFLICRLPYKKMLEYFDSQVDYIDDWCTCDTFCSGLRKLIRGRRAEFLDLNIERLLEDRREFTVRVGLVILKCYYVELEYLNLIFDRVEGLAGREEYYIRMAIAWLLAECFIKSPDETLYYLTVSHLPKWTYNKTISKICDSLRVELEVKETLKRMRR